MTFAQYYDPQGSWPYFGEVLRATSTDMFMVYGQPVLDPSILLRPFQVGFLFLGLSRGLSFYWSARLIALFMASFEFGRMLTDNKRGLSLAYASLVALAPAVSWWFSINSLVEMVICISVIAVCFNLYVQEGSVWAKSKKRRILLIVVCAYACLVFVFSVYPAWQVPLAYVLLAVIIALAVSHRSTLWRVLDPSGESKVEWNRYAHLPCTIVSESIGHSFTVTQLDSIAISLTLSDLDKLGVSYIVTNEKPALSEEEMARLTTISVCGDYTIYKLESQ